MLSDFRGSQPLTSCLCASLFSSADYSRPSDLLRNHGGADAVTNQTPDSEEVSNKRRTDRPQWRYKQSRMSLRMSRRRSTGDLVPKDITEILAREAKAQRGQKTQARSLGQAFNWLRRSKRKKKSTGPNRAFNDVTENTAELQNHDEGQRNSSGSFWGL